MKSPVLYVFAGIGVLTASFVGYTQFVNADARSEQRAQASAVAKDAAIAKAGDYVLVRYDGGEIYRSELDKMWKVMFAGRDDAPQFDTLEPAMRMDVLRNLAREFVLLKEAQAAGADQSQEVKDQLEAMKRQLTIQAYLKGKVDTLVPEAKVKEQYEALKKQFAGKEEVKARHILLKTQDEAKKIAEELKKGGDFAKIAKEKSSDPASGAKGGELGYFTREQMVPEFATAAFKLKKDEISAPVKSDFGWHIIQVEDRRAVEAPKYEDVKEKLKQNLAGQAVQDYVDQAAKDADVKFYDKDGKELADVKADASAPAAGLAGGMSPIPASKKAN